MILRWYQQKAIEALYAHLGAHSDNPCIVIPTAGGKTPVMAEICKDVVQLWGGRILILAHVKELLEQAVEKLQDACPESMVGVYSAGLGQRDTLAPIIVAGIQSVHKRSNELGHFDLVLVDEAHLIPDEGEGMYRTLLTALKVINPQLKVVGLTATPYRLGSGSICSAENILNAVCFEVGVKELITQGFICPLITRAGKGHIDTSSLHVRGGEFVSAEVDALIDTDIIVSAAVSDLVDKTVDRRSVLIFAASVKHAEHIAASLERKGQKASCIFGDTLDFERESTLKDFKDGKIKYLVNVNVLTTGFDAPRTDTVVLLRPTMSPGLYYQMVGRGFRMHPSKKNCLVLDYGGNVLRHGPVDCIKIKDKSSGEGEVPARECPDCGLISPIAFKNCPECGYLFPTEEKESKLTEKPTRNGIISGEVTETTYPVSDVLFQVWNKKNAPDDAPKTLRVDYKIGFAQWQSEWICVEHQGFAGDKARRWWKQRTNAEFPVSAQDACDMARAGVLRMPISITVREVAGKDFAEISAYDIGEFRDEATTAVSVHPEAYMELKEEEIPF